jgi:hypothetical protein
MENSDTITKNREQGEWSDNFAKLDDKKASCGVGCMKEKEEEDIPKWAHFICPSCGISYGISALVKAIRKRRRVISHEISDIN